MHKGTEEKKWCIYLYYNLKFLKNVKEEICLSDIFFSFLIMKNNLILESQLAQISLYIHIKSFTIDLKYYILMYIINVYINT